MFNSWRVSVSADEVVLVFQPLDGVPTTCGRGPVSLLGHIIAFVAEAAEPHDLVLVNDKVFTRAPAPGGNPS